MKYFANIFVLINISACVAPLDKTWFHETDVNNIVNYFNSLPEKKVCDIWIDAWNQQERRNSDIRKYIFLAMKDRKNDGYYCHKPFLDAKNRAEESLG